MASASTTSDRISRLCRATRIDEDDKCEFACVSLPMSNCCAQLFTYLAMKISGSGLLFADHVSTFKLCPM